MSTVEKALPNLGSDTNRQKSTFSLLPMLSSDVLTRFLGRLRLTEHSASASFGRNTASPDENSRPSPKGAYDPSSAMAAFACRVITVPAACARAMSTGARTPVKQKAAPGCTIDSMEVTSRGVGVRVARAKSPPVRAGRALDSCSVALPATRQRSAMASRADLAAMALSAARSRLDKLINGAYARCASSVCVARARGSSAIVHSAFNSTP